MRVLIAEDERRVAEAVARGLRREGMAVDVSCDGESALFKGRSTDYDVIVLDRDLPALHGDEVCSTLRSERPELKILMLTASGEIDDYMPKPFAFAELVARLRSLGRRSGPARPAVLRAGEIELDPARHTVTRAGRELELTPKEFAVLEVLMGAGGAAVSSEELLRRVWDENADPFTNTVRMTVSTLRRKLGDPSPIETVTGAGYRV